MSRAILLAVVVAMISSSPAAAQVPSGTGGGEPDTGGSAYTGRASTEDNFNTQYTSGGHEELVAGAALVKAQKFADAIPRLEAAVTKEPRNVQALIYLGFAYRMVGAGQSGDARNAEFAKALAYYQQALKIEPDNKLLHEYLGKIYVLMQNQNAAANELATLERLCPAGCTERRALAVVLSGHASAAAQSPDGNQ